MSIEVKMPALSPTMEKGTLAKWLVKEGDVVRSGDLIAEIETDKATMELEASDEGAIAKIIVREGEDDVAVGTVIALMGDVGQGHAAAAVAAAPGETSGKVVRPVEPAAALPDAPPLRAPSPDLINPRARLGDKVKVSPLAARIARAKRIDLSHIAGTGPGGRILKADLGLALPPSGIAPLASPPAGAGDGPAPAHPIADVPHALSKLSSMRRTIARRLTESKRTVPHIYLTVDIELDALLALRSDLAASLADRDVKITINDLIVKALALALIEVPVCNVQFAGDEIARFERADISVAVSIPNGLITPIVVGAESKSMSTIAREMRDLAGRAREGRLLAHEYQGGTASLSNLGTFGIKQFQAVINPPQAMIMAVGAATQQPVVRSGRVEAATLLSATGSFDHRAIDGADAAQLMQAFKRLIETPMLLLS